jgi:glutamyl-tRNA reductase
VPALAALRAYFEAARGTLLAEQPDLTADEATRLLINRLLHRPSEALRNAAAEGADRVALEALLARLFAAEPDSSRSATEAGADRRSQSAKERPS